VESLGGHAVAVRDVRDLSRHLAQSYEELNLIYRVSSNLTVLNRPETHIEEVCRDLLDVTVVESFVALLEPFEAGGEPRLLHAGPVPAAPDQLIRLYQQVRGQGPNAGAALVVNNADGDSAYWWATQWLRQFVHFPLERQDRSYGGLLAINHVDSVDFGSEEIQLISAVVERSAAYIENVRLYEDLEQLFMGMLHALVSSIDAKDPYTRGHSQRVAWLSRHLAGLLGLDEDQCGRVYLSGLLHDVGKIGVSEAVLRKTGRLSDGEFDEMKRHPEIGARILQAVRQIEDVIPGVLEHHERFDGRGYPRGLTGRDISTMGRIIALADSFDAMTSSRTYRTAHPLQITMAELRRWSGTQFDPRLVDLLLREDPADLLRVMSHSEKQPLVRDTGLASRLRGEAAS
jgi:GAF domain-containing protein